MQGKIEGICTFLQFVVYVAKEKEEGLYNLNFHNCMNYGPIDVPSTIDMSLQVNYTNCISPVFIAVFPWSSIYILPLSAQVCLLNF